VLCVCVFNAEWGGAATRDRSRVVRRGREERRVCRPGAVLWAVCVSDVRSDGGSDVRLGGNAGRRVALAGSLKRHTSEEVEVLKRWNGNGNGNEGWMRNSTRRRRIKRRQLQAQTQDHRGPQETWSLYLLYLCIDRPERIPQIRIGSTRVRTNSYHVGRLQGGGGLGGWVVGKGACAGLLVGTGTKAGMLVLN
jgi:hypothetical protein